MSRPLLIGCAIVLGCALIAAAAIVDAPAAPSLRVQRESGAVSVIVSGYAGRLAFVCAPATTAPSRIYSYYDGRYASGRGMSPEVGVGFPDHLRSALEQRGYQADVELVDAGALRRVLTNAPAGTAIVVLGGILPDTVRTARVDLLRDWIRAGGLVFWAGEPFDAIYARRGTEDAPGSMESPDYRPWRALYAGGMLRGAHDVVSPPLVIATKPSRLQPLLGITADRTTFFVAERRLKSRGGAPLAYVDERGASSASSLRIGRGAAVIFGDALDNELQASDAIAQILWTRAWADPLAMTGGALASGAMGHILVRCPPRYGAYAYAADPGYALYGSAPPVSRRAHS